MGADQIVTAIVAVVAVPLVLLGYIILGERVIERLPERVQTWIRPYFWALPAIGFATVFMVYPLLRTVLISFRNNADDSWVGFNNYVYFFTFPDTLTSLRNSLLWLVFYTGVRVTLAVVIAILLDRVRSESLSKVAISLLGPTSAVVGMTMIINARKTFDIVYVLTAGAYDTGVIATQMFSQLEHNHYSRAAAVGVVLFVSIVPLLVINIRRFQQQEEHRCTASRLPLRVRCRPRPSRSPSSI